MTKCDLFLQDTKGIVKLPAGMDFSMYGKEAEKLLGCETAQYAEGEAVNNTLHEEALASFYSIKGPITHEVII